MFGVFVAQFGVIRSCLVESARRICQSVHDFPDAAPCSVCIYNAGVIYEDCGRLQRELGVPPPPSFIADVRSAALDG